MEDKIKKLKDDIEKLKQDMFKEKETFKLISHMFNTTKVIFKQDFNDEDLLKGDNRMITKEEIYTLCLCNNFVYSQKEFENTYKKYLIKGENPSYDEYLKMFNQNFKNIINKNIKNDTIIENLYFLLQKDESITTIKEIKDLLKKYILKKGEHLYENKNS